MRSSSVALTAATVSVLLCGSLNAEETDSLFGFDTRESERLATLSLAPRPTEAVDPLGAASLGVPLIDFSSYFGGHIGPLWFLCDFESLDTGYSIEGFYGVKVLPFLSVEAASGYFAGETGNSVSGGELEGVPLRVDAKLTLPILFFEVFGGAGIGAYYLHVEARNGGAKSRDEDVVFGGNAFAGIGMALAGLFVSAEARYTVTEEADLFGGKARYEGIAALVTVGLRF